MTQYSGKIIRKTPVVPSQTSASGVWTTADAAAAVKNNTWPVAGVPNPISRSVRTRSSASAYFNRTFTTPTSTTKWTWSAWVKRGTLGAAQTLFGGSSDVNNWGYIGFLAGDTLSFSQADAASVTSTVTTTQLFRDPSAWYHIQVAFDSTQATAANRLLMYINGTQVTAFGTATYLAQNTASRINLAVAHTICRLPYSAANYVDGYATEVNFIDGQALTPSSFGTTDSLSGAWIPMPYTGTYGTNGFYLNFKDNTSTTTLGYDYSGNSNNWTANNISLTAGTTYDSMVDVPTLWMPYNTAGDVGATVRGNYAVGNPVYTDAAVSATYTNGNLTWSCPNTGSGKATISATTGKFYWEAIYLTNAFMTGVSDVASVGRYNNSIVYQSDGTKGINGTFTSYGATYTTGDVIGVALDLDGGTVTFYKNNSSQGSISLSLASITNATAIVVGGGGFSNTGNWNFGQRPFTYTPPSGFKTLNTFNLPAPTISNGASYMAATLYTGNNSTQTVANTVNGVSMQPDFVWLKSRQYTTVGHSLFDALRPIGANTSLPRLVSNSTDAEANNGGLTAFVSTGFSLNNDAYVNSSTTGGNMVAWQWNAGGSTVTNTSGSISAQVRANTTAGFSIVTYTGTGANATVGHGLGVAPKMIILKSRVSATNWVVYHANLTSAAYVIQFNLTNAQSSSPTIFNSTAPTSSVFSIGTSSASNDTSMVAYCFAAVAGYSAFGSYTGNASTDGPFVYTGFRPRWVMMKRTDSADDWVVFDTSRNTYDVMNSTLFPNGNYSETTDSNRMIDTLSNGFKIRSSPVYINASGGTYIYAAFAENPFKYSNAR